MTTSSHIIRPVMEPKQFSVARKDAARTKSRPAGFWQTWWDRIIPFGYEDETGFHYGAPTKSTADK